MVKGSGDGGYEGQVVGRRLVLYLFCAFLFWHQQVLDLKLNGFGLRDDLFCCI